MEIRPISFSTFFKGLSARNFKIMAEKAGLCNICTELGAENFVHLDRLLTGLGEILRSQRKPDITPWLMSKAKKVKGYLLSEFQANLKSTVTVPLIVLVFGFRMIPLWRPLSTPGNWPELP